MSTNYYYKRTRQELSFTVNDIAMIAGAINLTPFDIIWNAEVGNAGNIGQTNPFERYRIKDTDQGGGLEMVDISQLRLAASTDNTEPSPDHN